MPSAAFLRMPSGRFSLKNVRTSSRNAFSSGVKRRSMASSSARKLFVMMGSVRLCDGLVTTQVGIASDLRGGEYCKCREVIFQMRVAQCTLRRADGMRRATERNGGHLLHRKL